MVGQRQVQGVVFVQVGKAVMVVKVCVGMDMLEMLEMLVHVEGMAMEEVLVQAVAQVAQVAQVVRVAQGETALMDQYN